VVAAVEVEELVLVGLGSSSPSTMSAHALRVCFKGVHVLETAIAGDGIGSKGEEGDDQNAAEARKAMEHFRLSASAKHEAPDGEVTPVAGSDDGGATWTGSLVAACDGWFFSDKPTLS
jgi:hypothetical protein